jgi:hypothetical protein
VARKSIQNISLGRLEKLEVNIEGVKMKDDFEVMEIMDYSNPYHVLLGIDWAFENNAMLNLKNQHISFKTDTQCVISPLYPNEGDWYNESVDEDAQILVIKNIYKIIGNHKYYVNPMMDGELSWRSVSHMKLIQMTPWKGGRKNFMKFQKEGAHVLPPKCMKKSLDPTDSMGHIWWIRLLHGCITFSNTNMSMPLIH